MASGKNYAKLSFNCLSLARVFFRTEATSETDKVDGLISAWEEKVLLLYIDSVFKGASLFAKECHRLLSRLYSFSFPEVSQRQRLLGNSVSVHSQ